MAYEVHENEIDIAGWTARGEKLFGAARDGWQFVCPACGGVQCVRDFKEKATREYPANAPWMACIGSYMEGCDNAPESGLSPCTYNSLEIGAMDLNPLMVVSEYAVYDGEVQNPLNYNFVFDFAEPKTEGQ